MIVSAISAHIDRVIGNNPDKTSPRLLLTFLGGTMQILANQNAPENPTDDDPRTTT